MSELIYNQNTGLAALERRFGRRVRACQPWPEIMRPF